MDNLHHHHSPHSHPHEEGRGFRIRKKPSAEQICCPVCGLTIRSAEIEQHYAIEVDRLLKLKINKKSLPAVPSAITANNGSNGSSTPSYHEPLPGCSSNGTVSDESSGCPWVTFQKIRGNRHSRLRIKTRKRKNDEPICPVCNERPAPGEDINIHVELCLRRNENTSLTAINKPNNGSNPSDDDESIDIEGESFEEYEWAGQKRVRASSFLQGGYSATGMGTSIASAQNANDDEDEDLNVDGDDTQIYGPPQYFERDVILPLTTGDCAKEEYENNYLRKLVTGQDTVMQQQQQQHQQQHHQLHSQNSVEIKSEDNVGEATVACSSDRLPLGNISSSCSSNLVNCNIVKNQESPPPPPASSFSQNESRDGSTIGPSSSQIVDALKSKIREYENQITSKLKCLICMDEFHNPAVSICCWHVHCEECWLRTLGARKLCPQCNMITSPSDLRRIYM